MPWQLLGAASGLGWEESMLLSVLQLQWEESTLLSALQSQWEESRKRLAMESQLVEPRSRLVIAWWCRMVEGSTLALELLGRSYWTCWWLWLLNFCPLRVPTGWRARKRLHPRRRPPRKQ